MDIENLLDFGKYNNLLSRRRDESSMIASFFIIYFINVIIFALTGIAGFYILLPLLHMLVSYLICQKTQDKKSNNLVFLFYLSSIIFPIATLFLYFEICYTLEDLFLFYTLLLNLILLVTFAPINYFNFISPKRKSKLLEEKLEIEEMDKIITSFSKTVLDYNAVINLSEKCEYSYLKKHFQALKETYLQSNKLNEKEEILKIIQKNNNEKVKNTVTV